MQLMWFHPMPRTELPEDFRDANPSVWIDIHSSLFDPKRARHMYNDCMDELQCAARPVSTPFASTSIIPAATA